MPYFDKKKLKRGGTALVTGSSEIDIDGITGAGGVGDAAKEGAQIMTAAGQQAIKGLRRDLNPFRKILSNDQIQANSMLATDAGTQMNFLQNNPLFNSLMERSRNQIFSNKSAFGKLGSGGTQDALQESFLTGGNQLIDQQLGRVNPLLNIGSNAAQTTATSTADILTSIANAQAAGQIAAANASAQGRSDLIGGASTIGSAALSDMRLKTDINYEGKHGDFDVISWRWNDAGNAIGLNGYGRGHSAQQVQSLRPDLVIEVDGIKMINYATDDTVRPELWH